MRTVVTEIHELGLPKSKAGLLAVSLSSAHAALAACVTKLEALRAEFSRPATAHAHPVLVALCLGNNDLWVRKNPHYFKCLDGETDFYGKEEPEFITETLFERQARLSQATSDVLAHAASNLKNIEAIGIELARLEP